MTQFFPPGAQINNPNPAKIEIVRTDHEPVTEHHPVLDDERWSRMKPFTITIRPKGDVGIHALVVQYTLVDANGVRQDLPRSYDGSFDGKSGAVVFPHSATAFWPSGKVVKEAPPNRPGGLPLMPQPSPALEDMLEKAKSVTVSVPYIEFTDGTVYDEGGWADKMARTRATRLSRGRR